MSDDEDVAAFVVDNGDGQGASNTRFYCKVDNGEMAYDLEGQMLVTRVVSEVIEIPKNNPQPDGFLPCAPTTKVGDEYTG